MYGISAEIIVFVVQANADARRHATAAAGSLIGRGLRDRFDRQTQHLGSGRIAADPCRSRIDHVADVRYGQRRLGDVGRQDNAAVVRGFEDPMLLGGRQSSVQRQNLGRPRPVARKSLTAQSPGHLANVPFRRQEHQDVAAVDLRNLVHRRDQAFGPVDIFPLFGRQGTITNLDRVASPRHFDDRRRSAQRRQNAR